MFPSSIKQRVMGVGHSRHRVDLEVFVRPAGRHCLNRSPVSEWRLSIVEPLIAQVLHMVSIDVGHALSNFGSRNSSV